MLLERVINPSHPMYFKALKLYQISFPYHEQREEFSQEKIFGSNVTLTKPSFGTRKNFHATRTKKPSRRLCT